MDKLTETAGRLSQASKTAERPAVPADLSTGQRGGTSWRVFNMRYVKLKRWRKTVEVVRERRELT